MDPPTMFYEWDEAKRLSNIEKHGLDFQDVDLLFEDPHAIARARTEKGEERWAAFGFIDHRPVTAIFTYRGDAIRVISLRSANDGERAHYQAILG